MERILNPKIDEKDEIPSLDVAFKITEQRLRDWDLPNAKAWMPDYADFSGKGEDIQRIWHVSRDVATVEIAWCSHCFRPFHTAPDCPELKAKS